jgi:hypothetical protein
MLGRILTKDCSLCINQLLSLAYYPDVLASNIFAFSYLYLSIKQFGFSMYLQWFGNKIHGALFLRT